MLPTSGHRANVLSGATSATAERGNFRLRRPSRRGAAVRLLVRVVPAHQGADHDRGDGYDFDKGADAAVQVARRAHQRAAEELVPVDVKDYNLRGAESGI